MRFFRNHVYFLLLLFVMLIYRIMIWAHTHVYLYGDMYRYDAMARHLVLNGYMGIGPSPDAFYTPGYSLFLALIYRISMWFHSGILPAMPGTSHEVFFVQQVFSLVNLVLVYILGTLLKNRLTGFAAALIAAVYIPNSFVGELLLSENLFIPFILATLIVALVALRKNQPVWYALTGILLGMTALVRPLVLPLIVVIIIALFLRERNLQAKSERSYTKPLLQSVVLTGGTVLSLLPWWIRNAIDFHKFIPLSTEAGNPLLAGATPYFKVPIANLMEASRALHQSQETYAIHYILHGFTHHFLLYAGWFLFGKLYYLFWAPWLYNYIGWLIFYHRVLVILGGVAVVAGLFIREVRFVAVSSLFILGLELIFLPLSRYGYPILVIWGVLLPVVMGYVFTSRKRSNYFEKK